VQTLAQTWAKTESLEFHGKPIAKLWLGSPHCQMRVQNLHKGAAIVSGAARRAPEFIGWHDESWVHELMNAFSKSVEKAHSGGRSHRESRVIDYARAALKAVKAAKRPN